MDEPERQLWCAVIERAVQDAQALGDSVNVRRDRDTARDWLTRPSRDFNIACSLAGLDPDAVRERVTGLLRFRFAQHLDKVVAPSASKPRAKASLGDQPQRFQFANVNRVVTKDRSPQEEVERIEFRTCDGIEDEHSKLHGITLPLSPQISSSGGVGKDFSQIPGTGAGSVALDISQLEFSE